MENPGLKKHSGRPVVIMRRTAFEDNSPAGTHGGPLANTDDPGLSGVVPLYHTDHNVDVEAAPPVNSSMPHEAPISAENGDHGSGPMSLKQSAITAPMTSNMPSLNLSAVPFRTGPQAKGLTPPRDAQLAARQQADSAALARQNTLQRLKAPGGGSGELNQTHTRAEQQIADHARMEGRTTASYQAYHDVRDDLGRFAPKGTRKHDEQSIKPGQFQQAENEMGTTKALAWDRLRRAHPHVEIGPDETYDSHYKRLRAERRKQKDPKREHNKIKNYVADTHPLFRTAGQRYEYGSCPVCDAEMDQVCTSTKPGPNYGKPTSRPHPEREKKPVAKQSRTHPLHKSADHYEDDGACPNCGSPNTEESSGLHPNNMECNDCGQEFYNERLGDYGPPRSDHPRLTGPGSIGLHYQPFGGYGYYHTESPNGIYHNVEWDPNEGEYRVSSTDSPMGYDDDDIKWLRTRAQDPSEVAGAIRRHEIALRGGGEHGEAGGKGWWNPKARTMDMVADTTPLERALNGGKADRAVYGSTGDNEA